MLGLINRAHAPFAQLGEQLVLADHRQIEVFARWTGNVRGNRHFCAARLFVGYGSRPVNRF